MNRVTYGSVPFISRRLQSFIIGFWCILASDILEHVAFYTLLGGIVVFLNGQPLQWTEINALYIAFIFIGITYSSAFFGSLIADLFLGNFKTICLGYVIYIAGYGSWLYLVTNLTQLRVVALPDMCSRYETPNNSTGELSVMENRHSQIYINNAITPENHLVGIIGNISSVNQTAMTLATTHRQWMHSQNCSWPIIFIMCVIALGCGLVRANTARFGAEHQMEFHAIKKLALTGKNESVANRDRKYLKQESTNVRDFFSLLSWLSNSGSLLAIGGLTFIQFHVDYMHLSFVIATSCLVGAFVIFVCGRLWYLPSKTIPKEAILSALKATCCRTKQGYEVIETSASTDGADHQYNEEDGKRFWFLAIICLILVPYWLIYHQMLTTYFFQGVHMDLVVNGFQLPVTWMYLIQAGVVAILIPVIQISILPHLESIGRPLSMRARMIIGIVFAIASVALAGGLEHVRLNTYWEGNSTRMKTQTINNDTFDATEMSVLWQFPQYFLMGISDSFASVAGIELVYSQIPNGMRGLGLGIFWLFSGLASFLSCIISRIGYNHWLFDWDVGNPNCRLVCEDDITKICYECKMENFFFIFAGLACLCLILFVFVTYRWNVGLEYKYDQKECSTNSVTRDQGFVAESLLGSVITSTGESAPDSSSVGL
ncbi:solute carrier family 15 member 4-like [Lineus longissimus]|uniref:solute carrier family 15 member 4-like n=1 Tax=Lineus longissimus TaxID=88925 RepID=UPI00315D4ABC